ncbi:MAG: DEAD/DEAH box helicase [Gemmatimonadaceae bacterium]
MPFSNFELDPNLVKGIREMGFLRPTPIQADAIPPAMEGRDLLACASTGSGKTAAFLLPILHKLIARPRGKTRALVVTPTRELALQIVEQLDAIATHTPVRAAAVIGGVGMGPQEHAFRSGADVIVATPGRLLDHMKAPYAKLDSIEFLVLDEADRMLDMGFLPDIKRILKTLPTKRQTLFFSATMPGPIGALASQMLKNPATINLERNSKPATGITQALYPVPQELKSALFLELLNRGDMEEALVFTRTKHRANRLAEYLAKNGIKSERIHGNRSQSQRTEALAGFKSGKYRVLVATDIAARGIDVEALGHVVNFDVPPAPEDYIHRVGRTGRAELTGEAFTFFSPQEEGEIKGIERAISKRLPRVILDGFDYSAKPQQRFEVPIAERIAEIRKKKAEDRARSAAKAARKATGQGGGSASRSGSAPARSSSRGAPSNGAQSSGAPSPYRSGAESGPQKPGAGRGRRRR